MSLVSQPKPEFTELPDYIFLLSDHTTRSLACDVAKKLETYGAAAWDFLMPIHEATQILINGDKWWGTDFGDPRAITSIDQDIINSLEKWYNEHFGEENLGKLAFEEVSQNLSGNTMVFRDATWTHIKPFLTVLKPHQLLIIALVPLFKVETSMVTTIGPRVIFPHAYDVDTVVKQILEASK